ncbi:MAG TPA: Gfo/Idh/MocA family oxidoreductase [Bryobacteraceae bacterium]|nr:Gfo/Idh/MocA family oxidoreductase [Bryobacteraceae bacterium]
MHIQTNRRGFLMSSLALSAAAQSRSKEIRVGVLGAGARGVDMMRISMRLPGVRVAAICDVSEQRTTRAQQVVEEATGQRPTPYSRSAEDYKRMLDSPDLDVVLVMTPQNQHAAQSIYAMNSGKHVGSETPVAYTLDECWALVEAKEKTGRRFMLLENYPYARSRMMVLNMAHSGVLGEVTYGEGCYIHDTRNLAYEKDGSLTWRGEIARKYRGDVYPTHGMGPVSLWLGVNRGDRYATVVSMDTGTRGLQSYAREHFGKDHPAAQPGFFQKGDTTITMLRTANEKLAVVRYESGSTRPGMGWESLNGTRGAYDGSPQGETIYLAGRTKGHGWEPLEKYRSEYEHPYWKNDGETAIRTGHGGGDYFVMREFFRAIAEDREPPIDVYDGVTWSAVLPLSSQSIREGNKSLAFPDFTRGRWKDRKLGGFGVQPITNG